MCELLVWDSIAALRANSAAWWELWRRDPRATPFQSPVWVIPWAEQFASRSSLHVLAAVCEQRLVALLPLFFYDGPAGRTGALLGAGISDYLDVLVAPGAPSKAVAGIWERVLELAEHARLDWTDLPGGSPLIAFADGVPRPHGVCPRRLLPESNQDFGASLPKWLWRNVRQGEARLRRAGGRLRRSVRTTLARDLEALFELHGAEWRARGTPGVLASAEVRAFHRRAAESLLERGVLRLQVAELDGRPIGVLLTLDSRDTSCIYTSGFDPAHARLNLGSVLIASAAEDAIARGKRWLDFLRGAERYKYHWGAQDRRIFRLEQRSVSNRAAPLACHPQR
ncbi:MAG TPA: GNAT family N-acetyltransferase [Polyangiaceae bacterium]|nr:GNAT family N-acetyltransferase [Polyangiaceae bacterium]